MQNHITLGNSASHTYLIRDALAKIEEGLARLESTYLTLVQMKDGDGSLDAHYVYMSGKIGATDGAAAKAAFLELESLYGKLTTNASVTNVNAAIHQCCNKLR